MTTAGDLLVFACGRVQGIGVWPGLMGMQRDADIAFVLTVMGENWTMGRSRIHDWGWHAKAFNRSWLADFDECKDVLVR